MLFFVSLLKSIFNGLLDSDAAAVSDDDHDVLFGFMNFDSKCKFILGTSNAALQCSSFDSVSRSVKCHGL